MKKLLIILVMVSWCGVGFAESSLPECKGSNSKKWTNCQGTIDEAGQYKYVGEFLKGKMHGQGIFTTVDENTYVGEFKNDKMHGQGTLTSVVQKTKFVGEWKKGKLEGQGTAISLAGKYVGEFKDFLPHGQGTFKYADGGKYNGKMAFGMG